MKIFLGAASGVGKAYEMLVSDRSRRKILLGTVVDGEAVRNILQRLHPPSR